MEKVSYENILAGLILKFGKASFADVSVVIEDLASRFDIIISPFAIDFKGITNCVVNLGDTYYALEGSNVLLEEKQGDFIKEYLDNLNVSDFVLLKLNKLGNVSEYSIGTVFSEEQETAISELVDEFKAVYVWNDDVPYDDYRELQLTSCGKSRVFELQYFPQVEEFKRLLREDGYDVRVMSDFLMAQDFNLEVYDILNLDNFLYFCRMYDRCPYAPVRHDDKNKKRIK